MAASTVNYKAADTGNLNKYLADKVKSAFSMAAEERKTRDDEIKQLKEKKELTDEEQQRLDFLTKQQSGRKGAFFGKALAAEFGGDKARRLRGTFSKDPAKQNDPSLSKTERFSALLDRPEAPAEDPIKPETPFTQLSIPGLEQQGKTGETQGLQQLISKSFDSIVKSYDVIAEKISALGSAERQAVSNDKSNSKFLNNIASGIKSFKEYFNNDNKLKKVENDIESEQLELELDKIENAQSSAKESSLEAGNTSAGTSSYDDPYASTGGLLGKMFSGIMDTIGGITDAVDNLRRRKNSGDRPRTSRDSKGSKQSPNNSPPRKKQSRSKFFNPFSRRRKLSEGGVVPNVGRKSVKKMAAGGVYTNPTNIGLNPGDSVIPLNRNNAMADIYRQGSKGGNESKLTEPFTNILQLPSQVGGGLLMGLLSKAMQKLGGLASILKPVIAPIAQPLATMFGLPATIIGSLFGGSAQAATLDFDPSKYLGGGGKSEGPGGGGGGGAPPPAPTGSLSAAPQGNETGIQSLTGGTPIELGAGSNLSNTGLHHGKEDTRRGKKVRDYFIGGKSGPSNGSDGLGARLYTPLGFGPLKYVNYGPHGIAFQDPNTGEQVGMYWHVNDPQHQLNGKVIQPGTFVGTQGGLPGTPSASPGSSSVHLHVEGTEAFHNAVISTYAGGNILKVAGGMTGAHQQTAQGQNPGALPVRAPAAPGTPAPKAGPSGGGGGTNLFTQPGGVLGKPPQKQPVAMGVTQQFPVQNPLALPIGNTGGLW